MRELMRGHRARYAAAIFAMALSNVFLFAPPLISRAAIDGALGDGAGADSRIADWLLAFAGEGDPLRAFLFAGLAIVAFTVVGGGFLYLRGRWAATAAEAIARDLRKRVYSHLDHLPCAYHDRVDTGDLVQRATSDVETVRVFFAAQVVEIGRAALLLLTVLPILVSLDGRMTLVSIALFPVILAFAVVFFRRIQRLFLATDEAEGEMTSVLQENLTGIRVVRAFARQDFEREKFAAKNAKFRDRTYKLIRYLGSYWAASDFLCVTQIGLALGYGAMRLHDGSLSVGTLFAFLAYQGMVLWPLRHLGRVLTDTGKALVALGRLGEILHEPEEADSVEATALAEMGETRRVRGAIDVENLTFAYGDGEPALRDVSFRIDPGETLALIGPPGSGKSTLVALLLRLYDHEQGSIRLDGRELRDWPRRRVRSAFGVVLQEPFLYSRTIGANVRVGRTEASLEEVVEATAAADIHRAIEDW
jgi:ATP-binding cassette subfamily B protein